MTWFKSSGWSLMLVAALLAAPALAQTVDTGNLYVKVVDGDQKPVPGVTVTVSGIGAPHLQVSNLAGEARFLNLAPGVYSVESDLKGFTKVLYKEADVRVGRNTSIVMTTVPSITDVVTVVAEQSPLLDPRKISNTTTVTRLELDKLPTSRDPWAVVAQTPGVVMDRINVGGNESGQQANFTGTGSRSDQNVFLLDGVNITDPAALGGSSTYFGFDQFEEMQFSTGGSDITAQTPGVQISLVTRRGTNDWRGSGRYFTTDGDWQSNSGFDRGEMPPAQRQSEGVLRSNEIVEISDYGAELGGPMWRNKAWIWGSYDKTDIQQSAFGGTRDDTLLENFAAKINAQPSSNNSLVGSFNEGNKQKFGRDAGPDRPTETTFDQDGPSPVYKLEDSHIFSSSLMLTGSWSRVDGAFSLTPKGGLENEAFQDDQGIWRRTFYLYLDTERPVDEARLSGSKFFATPSATHELKFGGSQRVAENNSILGFTGRGIFVNDGANVGLPEGLSLANALRDKRVREEVEVNSLWLQDTITWDRLTVNAGARYDRQKGHNLASSTPGVREPALALASADVVFGGNEPDFEWENVLPRIGVTYALGADRDTLVRGSYSRFADQLGSSVIEHVNPASYSGAYYAFSDVDGDGVFEPGSEPFTLLATNRIDPNNPGSAVSLNRIDPNYKAKTTDEIVLALEHAWMPELTTGLALTYREIDNISRTIPLVRDANGDIRLQTREDFVPFTTLTGTLPDGTSYSEDVWVLDPSLSATGASLLTTGGRTQEYLGVGLTFTKRLSNRWMLRGNLGYSDWTWNINEEFRRFDDPTNSAPRSPDLEDIEDDDGAIVAERSGGSGNKGGVFLQAGWSLNINGLYQVAPEKAWGFNVGWNLTGREGTPIPFDRTVTRPRGGTIAVALTDAPDSFRTDDVFSLDARLDKDFTVGPVQLTASLDGFNLFNNGAVLQRNLSLATRPNFVNEALSPRIFRAGLRVSLR